MLYHNATCWRLFGLFRSCDFYCAFTSLLWCGEHVLESQYLCGYIFLWFQPSKTDMGSKCYLLGMSIIFLNSCSDKLSVSTVRKMSWHFVKFSCYTIKRQIYFCGVDL